MQIRLASVDSTARFARCLSECVRAPTSLFFYGDLGAGKTTFIRAFLQAAGVTGRVKSPTYTMVEPYTVNAIQLYHFDLYRLEAPDALDAIGISDYFMANSICLFEWPERGQPRLPDPDITVKLQYPADAEDDNERDCEILFDDPAIETQFVASIS